MQTTRKQLLTLIRVCFKAFRSHPFSAVADKYLKEVDSIALEWQYLRQIPKADRDSLVPVIERNSKISAIYKGYVIKALETADLPFQEYLKIQQPLRGYSKAQFIKSAKVGAGVALGTTAVMLAPIFAMLGFLFYPSER